MKSVRTRGLRREHGHIISMNIGQFVGIMLVGVCGGRSSLLIASVLSVKWEVYYQLRRMMN